MSQAMVPHFGKWPIQALFAVLLAGCNSEPFEYVPVSGQITYEDGTPLPVLPAPPQLNFFPQASPVDAKTSPRPGVAYVDAQGKFSEATSHRWADGLTRGQHKVTVSTFGAVQQAPAGVPAEYNDLEKTPLTVDTANAPFVLKVRKP